MYFFEWDLMIVTPAIIAKLMMANGIIFENEGIQQDHAMSVA